MFEQGERNYMCLLELPAISFRQINNSLDIKLFHILLQVSRISLMSKDSKDYTQRANNCYSHFASSEFSI